MATNKSEDADVLRHKVCAIASRLSTLTPRNRKELALHGYLIGAAYSLKRAIRFRYRDYLKNPHATVSVK